MRVGRTSRLHSNRWFFKIEFQGTNFVSIVFGCSLERKKTTCRARVFCLIIKWHVPVSDFGKRMTSINIHRLNSSFVFVATYKNTMRPGIKNDPHHKTPRQIKCFASTLKCPSCFSKRYFSSRNFVGWKALLNFNEKNLLLHKPDDGEAKNYDLSEKVCSIWNTRPELVNFI